MIPDKFPKMYPREFQVLVDMIGNEQHIFLVDQDYIYHKLVKGLWKATFNKLWLFNLVDYDKLIILDQDVLIRQNIIHWFDYEAPAATQAGDAIEWNSGAMVIEPKVFQQMMNILPLVSPYNAKYSKTQESSNKTTDNWNSATGQQGFISSFFYTRIIESNVTNENHANGSIRSQQQFCETTISILYSTSIAYF